MAKTTKKAPAKKATEKVVVKEIHHYHGPKTVNGKQLWIYLVLCWFLGSLGIHNFYRGHTGKGITQLLFMTVGWITFGLLPLASMIWAVIELISGLINIPTPEKIFTKK